MEEESEVQREIDRVIMEAGAILGTKIRLETYVYGPYKHRYWTIYADHASGKIERVGWGSTPTKALNELWRRECGL